MQFRLTKVNDHGRAAIAVNIFIYYYLLVLAYLVFFARSTSLCGYSFLLPLATDTSRYADTHRHRVQILENIFPSFDANKFSNDFLSATFADANASE